jgi:hypothetical protein
LIDSAKYASARATAAKIVSGTMTPYKGAAAIWAALAEEPGEYPEELRIFVGLASEWQDHPEHRSSLDDDILDEARKLLARDRPTE